MQRIAAFGLGVALLWPGSAAHAEPPPPADWARSGFYLGVAGTAVIQNYNVPPPIDADHSIGINGRVGWRFNRYGAVEIQTEWNGDTNLRFLSDVTTVATTANLRWMMPAGRVEPYLIGGVGVFWAKINSPLINTPGPDAVLRGGVGLQFHVTEWLALVAEGTYVYPVDRLSDLQYASIVWGVQYKF